MRNIVVICLATCIGGFLTQPAVTSAAAPASAPATSPVDDALARADEILEAGSNLLNTGDAEGALAKYRAASDLYKKAQGTEETTEHAA